MAEYKIGVFKVATGYVDFLYQSLGGGVEAEEATAKDEEGDTAAAKFFDKRGVVKISAVVPKEQESPAKGTVVSLTCTVSPTGISFPDTGGTATDFFVESSEVTQANNDFPKIEMTLKRYLANGLPAAESAG